MLDVTHEGLDFAKGVGKAHCTLFCNRTVHCGNVPHETAISKRLLVIDYVSTQLSPLSNCEAERGDFFNYACVQDGLGRKRKLLKVTNNKSSTILLGSPTIYFSSGKTVQIRH